MSCHIDQAREGSDNIFTFAKYVIPGANFIKLRFYNFTIIVVQFYKFVETKFHKTLQLLFYNNCTTSFLNLQANSYNSPEACKFETASPKQPHIFRISLIWVLSWYPGIPSDSSSHFWEPPFVTKWLSCLLSNITRNTDSDSILL